MTDHEKAEIRNAIAVLMKDMDGQDCEHSH